MKLALLATSIQSLSANACEDEVGKFRIPEIDEIRNCQFVKNQRPDLCDTRKVQRRCPLSCNLCDIVADEPEPEDDDGHGHDHTDEHLLMTCDTSDELYVEHIDEIDEYCASVSDGSSKSCPHKCLQPMTVMKLFYSEVCPDMERSATFDLTVAANVCDLSDPWHPPEGHDDDHGHGHDHTDEHLLMACDYTDDLYVEHLDEINEYCADVVTGSSKTCPYKCLQPMKVLKLFYSEVCPDMVRSVTFELTQASGACDLGDGDDEVVEEDDDHHGHDHDHTDEHLQMTCDYTDDLYVEHIDEINEYCSDVVNGSSNTCPYKCLQPMTVLSLFYSEVCPDMVRSNTYDLTVATMVCDLSDAWHPPQDDTCVDIPGKFRIPEIDEIRNCQFVKNQRPDLCDTRKVQRRCANTCGKC